MHRNSLWEDISCNWQVKDAGLSDYLQNMADGTNTAPPYSSHCHGIYLHIKHTLHASSQLKTEHKSQQVYNNVQLLLHHFLSLAVADYVCMHSYVMHLNTALQVHVNT